MPLSRGEGKDAQETNGAGFCRVMIVIYEVLQGLNMTVGHIPVASFAVAVCKLGLSYPGIIIIKTPITIY